MSVFECEMREMWQFHVFYGSPNVQQEIFEIVHLEIFEIWVMGRPPKRHLKWQNKNKTKNNPFNNNREFARLCRLGP